MGVRRLGRNNVGASGHWWPRLFNWLGKKSHVLYFAVMIGETCRIRISQRAKASSKIQKASRLARIVTQSVVDTDGTHLVLSIGVHGVSDEQVLIPAIISLSLGEIRKALEL